MHNSPNRGVNYHIFQNKGNYPVIFIYALHPPNYPSTKSSPISKNYNSGKVDNIMQPQTAIKQRWEEDLENFTQGGRNKGQAGTRTIP